MRILFVDDPPLFSGGQRMLANYIDALAGEDIALIRPPFAPEPDSTWHVRTVYKVKFPKYPARMSSIASQMEMLPKVFLLTFRLFLIFLRERPDICMANSFYALIPLIPLKMIFRYRLAFMAHTMDIPLNSSTAFLLRNCTITLACCNAVGERLSKLLPSPPITIRNAVSSPSSKIERTQKSEDSAFKVVFASRMIPDKNPLNLAKAIKLLRDSGFNATLALFGDGPEKAKVEEFVSGNGLDGIINTRGFVGDAPAEVHAADCLCIPSEAEAEALPICILEALSAGVPVVATRKGGITEALVDGSTGFFAESASPEDIATAIRKVASANRHILARNSIKLHATTFNIEVQAKAFKDAMSKLSKA